MLRWWKIYLLRLPLIKFKRSTIGSRRMPKMNGSRPKLVRPAITVLLSHYSSQWRSNSIHKRWTPIKQYVRQKTTFDHWSLFANFFVLFIACRWWFSSKHDKWIWLASVQPVRGRTQSVMGLWYSAPPTTITNSTKQWRVGRNVISWHFITDKPSAQGEWGRARATFMRQLLHSRGFHHSEYQHRRRRKRWKALKSQG